MTTTTKKKPAGRKRSGPTPGGRQKPPPPIHKGNATDVIGDGSEGTDDNGNTVELGIGGKPMEPANDDDVKN